MTKTATILRFDPNGPNGLTEWAAMNPADLVSGAPVQRHRYHGIPDKGFEVGVWECTAFTDHMMPYAVDEFMLFLEGKLTMVLPNRTEVEIKAGDAFVIPKGFTCQWKQEGIVHKLFMILDGPVPEAANPSLMRITVPDLTEPAAGGAVSMMRTDFVNAAGTMRVSVQSCSAMSQPALKLQEHLLLHVLSGMLRLYDGETTHEFSKGETAYIHHGDMVGWETSEGTRLVTSSYADPG
jgi:uncharacterized cupin superfamily protein